MSERVRILAATGVAAAAVVVAIVLLGGGSSYSVHARYQDAGQLVTGSLVEVGGQSIGTVGEIALADGGQADVELKITEEDYQPLRRGTVARIRTVGLSGVANRYVDITAGDGEEISDGGVLTTRETRPVIDLDQLLNALDEPTRKTLQGIVRNGAKIYGGDGTDANRALAYLNPALAQTRAFSDELTRDAAAVDRLISSSGQVLDALADRRTDVEQSLGNTATTLSALASERRSLQSVLARAPGVFDQARGTFRRLRGTLREVRPVVRDLRPSARPLAAVLRATVPTARAVDPVARRLRDLLPDLERGLRGLRPLARDALPALRSTTTAVRDAQHIFAGLRPYAPDFVNGVFNGFGGLASNGYDANGHIVRVVPSIGAQSLSGLLSLVGGGLGPSGGGYRTGLTARCPGAATEPAPDGSNPFVPDPSLCDRGQDHP